MPPSEAVRHALRAMRRAAGAALPVAIATGLSTAPVWALSDAPGAEIFGKAALPLLRSTTAAAGAVPVPPALSGARSAAETAPAPASPAEQLAALRREAVAAARQVQKSERALAAIRHELDLLGSDIAARSRGLKESRGEQELLLGTVIHLARNPPGQGEASDLTLVERLRARALVQEAEPGLRARLRALADEIARIEALQRRIAAKQADEAAAWQTLETERERLASVVARRNALLRDMLPQQGIDAALGIAEMEREATGIGDLIKRAEAAGERRPGPRERNRPGGSRNRPAPSLQADDPTRPSNLRSLPQEAGLAVEAGQSGGRQQAAEPGVVPRSPPLIPPVAGTVAARYGEPGAAEAARERVGFKAVAGAVVIAPFDGKIIYAGPFRDLGRVLIIRHDHRYYSVLAGLGRVDAKLGDWVLAGEPVGAVPDVPSPASGAQAQELDETGPGRLLYYELRRDGRPVDPQPWLARVEDGHDERNGEQKVGQ